MLESMLSLTLNELQWSQFEVKPTQRPMFGPIERRTAMSWSRSPAKNLPEPDAGDRSSRVGERSALCEICRPPRKLGSLMEGVEAWSRTVTTAQCLVALNEHGVPSSAYRTVAEALRDPQIAHRGALAEVEDGGGTFKVLNLPFRMSGAKVSAAKAHVDARRTYARLSTGEKR
jgi:hypothetical protein